MKRKLAVALLASTLGTGAHAYEPSDDEAFMVLGQVFAAINKCADQGLTVDAANADGLNELLDFIDKEGAPEHMRAAFVLGARMFLRMNSEDHRAACRAIGLTWPNHTDLAK